MDDNLDNKIKSSDVSSPEPSTSPEASFSGGPANDNSWRRRLKWVVGLVVLLVVGWLIWHYTIGSSPTPAVNTTANEEGENGKFEATIGVTSNGFSPSTLNAKLQTKVSWENKDTVDHFVVLVTTNKDSAKVNDFGSKGQARVPVSGGYSFVFNQAGDYHFYDSVNPSNNLEIIVTP